MLHLYDYFSNMFQPYGHHQASTDTLYHSEELR